MNSAVALEVKRRYREASKRSEEALLEKTRGIFFSISGSSLLLFNALFFICVCFAAFWSCKLFVNAWWVEIQRGFEGIQSQIWGWKSQEICPFGPTQISFWLLGVCSLYTVTISSYCFFLLIYVCIMTPSCSFPKKKKTQLLYPFVHVFITVILGLVLKIWRNRERPTFLLGGWRKPWFVCWVLQAKHYGSYQ